MKVRSVGAKVVMQGIRKLLWEVAVERAFDDAAGRIGVNRRHHKG